MQYRYTKKLHNKIKQLNLDYKDTGGLLVCLYLNGCSEEDCAKLFEFTLDSIIVYLKYEDIYGYKICKKCEHLKTNNKFVIYENQKNICLECKRLKDKDYHQEYRLNNKEKIKQQSKNYYERTKEERKLYYLLNKEIKLEYMNNYYKDNREDRINYMKNYNEENREKINNRQNLYTLEHKNEIKEYREKNKKKIKEARKKYKPIKQKYMKEYRKEYNYRPANEEVLQKLELYEDIKGNQIKCRYCGDWYTPTNSEVQTRFNGILESDVGYIYCSEKCKEACPTYGRSLYPTGFKPASSREVNPVLRQLVFERDDYTCQKCFTHKDQLNCSIHCHHITPYVDSPIEGNDPDNCITLCKDCHKEVHEIPGCGYAELRCG